MTNTPEINWRTPDETLRHLLTSLDDDTVERAQNEIDRRAARSRGAPRLTPVEAA